MRKDNQFNIQYRNDSDSLSQFKDFLKDYARQAGGVRVEKIVPQKEVKSSFSDQDTESIEFDLMVFSNGTSCKVNFSVKPPSRDKNGKNGGPMFSMDMQSIKTEEEARVAFNKFNDLVNAYALKTHPKNQPMYIYTSGGGQWNKVGHICAIENLHKWGDKFREKGIDVYYNGKLIIGPESENQPASPTSSKRKPWEVPKTPKLTRD